MSEPKQIDKLYEEKKILERQKLVKQFMEYIKLPRTEQVRIWNKWEQYYKDVRKTVIYAMYQEMKSAFKKGDIKRVKELQAEIKQMRLDKVYPELPKPYHIEPQELSHDQDVIRYRIVLYEINKIASSPLEF